MVSACTFTACEHDESGAEALSKSETEYSEKNNSDIMQPPKNGWTIEELLSVSTLCDKQLSYPITMDMLGDDFSLNNEYAWEKDNTVGTSLYYRNEYLCSVVIREVKGIDDIKSDSPIGLISMCPEENFKDYISINSITFGSSTDDVINVFGSPTDGADKTEDKDNSVWDYKLYNEDKAYLQVVFSEGKVNYIVLRDF